MVETDIKIGPLRPTSGPLARTGGAAISSQSGSGPLDVRVRLTEQDIRSLQDQIYAISGFLNLSISVPMLIASGPNHQPGVAPDPGSTAGTAKFLREDSTWTAVSATALTGIVPVANGGTGTATGSITGTGALTFTSGGATKVILKPGTDSTTAVQVQNAAGTAVVSVDTTNSRVNIVGRFATSKGSVACVNGANNNLALPAAAYVSVTGPSGAFNITGFVAGADGQHLELWNPTGQVMTIKDQNGGSSAGNQIFTNTGADVVLGALSFMSFIYDSGSAIWVVRSHT